MRTDTSNMCPIVARFAGLILLIAGAVLTESRAGDWLFRSESFDERFSSLLLGLRIAAGLAGILLVIAGGKLGRAADRRWNTLSEPVKLILVTFILVFSGSIVVAASQYFRENMVLLETITRYQARYKLLGFDVLVQLDEMRTPDFLTSLFLAIGGTISYCMYSLYRLGAYRESLPGGPATQRMWLLFSLGLYYLTLDEYFGFHEFIGDNSPIFSMVSITHHPDDLVIAIYFLIALAIMFHYRRYLCHIKPALAMLVFGIALHLMAVIADAFVDSFSMEEGLELAATIFYCSAIANYALDEILSTTKRS